jgi:lipopolysaccharide biosynthesis glycosyltransferase
MISSQAKTSVGDARNPVVVLAADENFAMPLSVTVRSALEHLSTDRILRVYLLDAGLSDATKQRLERSWLKGRYRVSWTRVDASALGVVPVSGHVNLVSYYRILMPRLLPAEVTRAIYLDSDLVVCADLGKLWDCELGENLCLAAQDCAAPYLDNSLALANFEHCQKHLGSARPIANYRTLGLDPMASYFNAGVLLVDVAAWRSNDLATKMIDCLAQHNQFVRWWDQYALNVVLAGRWGRLDGRWNQGANIYVYPSAEDSPFDSETFARLRDNPYIIHFTTRYKPWLMSCLHPRRKQFFNVLDRTDWAGWRPWHTVRLRPFLDLAKAQQRRLRIMWRQLRSA